MKRVQGLLSRKVVLALNLATYRFDAFLTNFIDGIFIIGFKVVMDKVLEQRGFDILAIVFSPMVLHAFYMLVYIVNDFIDYGRDSGYKPRIDKSLYEFRPIYLFHRSRFVVLYAILLYLTYVILLYLTLSELGYLMTLFSGCFLLMSLAHSMWRGLKRIATFYLLRFVKYVFLLTIFNTVISGRMHDVATNLTILTLVLPYVAYSTLSYGTRFASRRDTLLCVALASTFLGVPVVVLGGVDLLTLRLMDVLEALTISYLTIVIPVLGVRQLLRRILGADNPTYYHHLLRLILGALLVLISLVFVIFILTLTY